MRLAHRSTIRAIALALAAIGALAQAGAARGALLQPLLDTSVVNRVPELVPLGPAGERIAIVGTFSRYGRRVGPGSYLAQDGILLAARDGSGLHTVWRTEMGLAIEGGLTATGDGATLAWIGPRGQAYAMDTHSERVHAVHGAGAPLDGFFAGPNRLYAMLDYGHAARWLDAGSSRLRPLRGQGAGAHAGVAALAYVVSRSRTQLASCGALLHRGRPAGLRLGLLDPSSATMRYRSVAHLAMVPGSSDQTCGVSDDGSTVATIGRAGDARYLLAMRGGRVVRIRVPRATAHVASLSPDGRLALVGGGADLPQDVEGLTRTVMLAGSVAIVDLDSGRVSPLALAHVAKPNPRWAGAQLSSDRAVWSADGQRLALGASAGALLVVNTATGRPTAIRRPRPPVGFAFERDSPPRPLAFSDDGRRVVFALFDKAGDITELHPYMAPVDGSAGATYLLTRSMASFQEVVRSADGRTAWVLPSSTCHTVYPQPLLLLAGGTLWDGPFEQPTDPNAP